MKRTACHADHKKAEEEAAVGILNSLLFFKHEILYYLFNTDSKAPICGLGKVCSIFHFGVPLLCQSFSWSLDKHLFFGRGS